MFRECKGNLLRSVYDTSYLFKFIICDIFFILNKYSLLSINLCS